MGECKCQCAVVCGGALLALCQQRTQNVLSDLRLYRPVCYIVKPMAAQRNGKPASTRERLLDAANQLFYEEGVRTVGVDRVVERAGVAKATLYTLFGNKDGLVRAYLMARDEAIRERITREIADRYTTPRER